MKAIWYNGPSGGELVASPTAEEIVERMRRGTEYWGQFGPHGHLEWYEHPTTELPASCGYEGDVHLQQLIFLRHSERGWFFEFSCRSPKRWLVPFDPAADRDDYFPQWAGGDSQMFLAGCFVPQETAERVIRDFMADGEPSSAVQWFKFGDVLPRMDADDLELHRRNVQDVRRRTIRSIYNVVPSRSTMMAEQPIAGDQWTAIDTHIFANRKLEAVKGIRDWFGLSLCDGLIVF